MKEKFSRFLKSLLTGMKSPALNKKVKGGFDRDGVPYLDLSDKDTADFIAAKLRKTPDLEV